MVSDEDVDEARERHRAATDRLDEAWARRHESEGAARELQDALDDHNRSGAELADLMSKRLQGI